MREKTDSMADEDHVRMLNIAGPVGEEKKRHSHMGEVKFIGDAQQNWDAQINIGNIEKEFSAMAKEELMKFTNDPFWVSLRWGLVLLFCLLWIVMFVTALYLVIDAPNCPIPEPLAWWEQGPFAKLSWEKPQEQIPIENLKSYGVNGIVVSLPPQDTYLVESNDDIQKNIKRLVDSYKVRDINVILDITPNYVPSTDELFKKALAGGEDERAAFGGWANKQKTNWKRIKKSESAWESVGSKSFVLSQFGIGLYDLQLKNDLPKNRLKNILVKLCKLGVNGIRLNNAKHFIIGKLEDEQISTDVRSGIKGYHSYTHQYSTYQEGLGKLLKELHETVKNATNNEGFLSIAGNYDRADFLHELDSTTLNVDLPKYGSFATSVAYNKAGESLIAELNDTFISLKPDHTIAVGMNSKILWPQWELNDISELRNISASEYNMFIMFLPGVPILPAKMYNFGNHSQIFFNMVNAIRNSSSFMHGNFELLPSIKSTIAYTRLKSGNPGYFVIYNPTAEYVTLDYSDISGMPEQLSVHALSDNYIGSLELKGKVKSDDITISKFTTIILSYVPKR